MTLFHFVTKKASMTFQANEAFNKGPGVIADFNIRYLALKGLIRPLRDLLGP